MPQPYAVVRFGRDVLAAGGALDQALSAAAECFYAGKVPADLEILERICGDLPPLAAVPCSDSVLASSSGLFGPGPVMVLQGVLHLEGEDQLSLF